MGIKHLHYNLLFLLFRVHLKKVTSSSIVPQAVIEQKVGSKASTSSGMHEIRRQQEMLSQREEENFTFHWQQKFYSQVIGFFTI